MSAHSPANIGSYNRDQLDTVRMIVSVLSELSADEKDRLRSSIEPYLDFRRRVAVFFDDHFRPLCKTLCFDTDLSACCGFESIITFFADHVISLLHSSEQQIRALASVLERPNLTRRCVFLGPAGCLWRIPPVSCAMFFCSRAKEAVFAERPEIRDTWSQLLMEEKRFTWPDRPVLFDDLESFFLNRGVDSPQMLFHRSPGLLRVKWKAGLGEPPVSSRRAQVK